MQYLISARDTVATGNRNEERYVVTYALFSKQDMITMQKILIEENEERQDRLAELDPTTKSYATEAGRIEADLDMADSIQILGVTTDGITVRMLDRMTQDEIDAEFAHLPANSKDRQIFTHQYKFTSRTSRVADWI